jgi:hypothetical protein
MKDAEFVKHAQVEETTVVSNVDVLLTLKQICSTLIAR